MSTYDPARTGLNQCAARCGLRLKYGHRGRQSVTCVLVDDRTGAVVFEGPMHGDETDECAWTYLKRECGLTVGAH